MQPAVTLVTLYPPIAAATVVNAFLFAGMWRGYQAERQTGKSPWWLGFGLAGYAVMIGLFAYFLADKAITGWSTIFAAALAGEAVGVVVVYAILNALVFTRGRPRGERVSAFVQSGLALCFLIVGLFAGK